MSTAGADCVIRPTEMKSTPVSAIARRVSSPTPPEASSGTLPPESATARRKSETHVVEQNHVGPRLERFRHLLERVAFDLDLRQYGNARAGALDGKGDRAAHADVIVLDEHAVVQAQPVVARSAQLRGVLLQRAQARSRFARVDQHRPRPRDALDVLRREGGDSRKVLEKIQRGSLHRKQPASRAFDSPHRRACIDAISVLHTQLHATLRHAATENLRGDVDPGNDDVLARVERELRARGGRNHQLRGEVGEADVLGERPVDQFFDHERIDHGRGL